MKLLFLTIFLVSITASAGFFSPINDWFWRDGAYGASGLTRLMRKIQDEDYNTLRYEWWDFAAEDINNYILSDMCNMTSDKMNQYNSFILDKSCLAAIEHAEGKDGECAQFKCHFTQFLYEKLPEILFNLFERPQDCSRSPKQYLITELAPLLESSGFCSPCARRFVRALTECGPTYTGNVMYALLRDDAHYTEDFMGRVALGLQNVNWEAVRIVLERSMGHLCTPSPSGSCAGSLTLMAQNIEQLYINSMVIDIDPCENPMEAYNDMLEYDRELDYDMSFPDRELALGERFAKSFFCKKECKETRQLYYPCCFRDILGDKKLKKNLFKLVENAHDLYYLLGMMHEAWWSGRMRDAGNPGGFRLSPEGYEYIKGEGIINFKIPKVTRGLFESMVSAPVLKCGMECADY